jgi:hypothetical protein
VVCKGHRLLTAQRPAVGTADRHLPQRTMPATDRRVMTNRFDYARSPVAGKLADAGVIAFQLLLRLPQLLTERL